MNKLVVTFMMLFFVGTLLSGVMEGVGGISTTQLTTAHTDAVTTLTVSNTEGFLHADYVQVGNEKVSYTGTTATTFTGCTRGWDGTEPKTYDSGIKVYNPGSSAINSALGFSIASTGASIGAIDIPIIIGRFFTTTLPRLILWDYSWLKGGWMEYLRYMLMAFSVGFLIYLAYMIASALGGIMQGMFRRGP